MCCLSYQWFMHERRHGCRFRNIVMWSFFSSIFFFFYCVSEVCHCHLKYLSISKCQILLPSMQKIACHWAINGNRRKIVSPNVFLKAP